MQCCNILCCAGMPVLFIQCAMQLVHAMLQCVGMALVIQTL